jgi:hypothetical protein
MMTSVYDVLLLLEQRLSESDAHTVTGLHEARDDAHYHVLLPVEDPQTRLESTLGALATSEMLGTSPLYLASEPDLRAERDEVIREARDVVAAAVRRLQACGAGADGEICEIDPVQMLVRLVAERPSDEVIILTRPHVVAETLHLDWTHKARKRLGVPVLHLLAHG